jgi:hypothetical protein
MLNQTPRSEDGWRSGGIALSILNLGTGRWWTVSFKLRPFYTWGSGPRYALDRSLFECQCWYGRCREEKNLLSLPGIELRFLGRPVHSLILYRLREAKLFTSKFFGMSGEVLKGKGYRTEREFMESMAWRRSLVLAVNKIRLRKQEVLGRINYPLSFDARRTAQKMTSPTTHHCRRRQHKKKTPWL